MKTNKNAVKTNQFRQGDVLLLPVDSIPGGLVKTKKVVLALGEVTGHSHTIFDNNVIGYAATEDALVEYVEVKASKTKKKATVKHEEHGDIPLPPGKYRSIIQSEYTPERIRNVAD